MSKNKKKPGKTQEKIRLKFDWGEKLDGGDFILKLQEAYSELISKGCSETQVELCSSYDDMLEILFSGTRELTQEEIEKEEAKKQEEKKLVEQMNELRRKLAEIKKS